MGNSAQIYHESRRVGDSREFFVVRRCRIYGHQEEQRRRRGRLKCEVCVCNVPEKRGREETRSAPLRYCYTDIGSVFRRRKENDGASLERCIRVCQLVGRRRLLSWSNVENFLRSVLEVDTLELRRSFPMSLH